MPYRRGDADRVRVMRGTDDVGEDDGSMFAAGPEHVGPKYPESDAEIAATEATEAAAMADAVFISMARSAVPTLLNELDALRAKVARLEARTARMCGCVNYGEAVANYTDDDCLSCHGSGAVIEDLAL